MVEVKRGLAAARALRDAMVQMVSWLAQSVGEQAYLVLVDPRITDDSLNREFDGFRAALRPDVAKRLHLAVVRDGAIENPPRGIGARDWTVISKAIASSVDLGMGLPRPDKQSEVLRVLLLQWFRGSGPVTSEWLENTVGTSYRTVASALERLGPAIERLEDRRILLRYFPAEAWARFTAVSRRARATIDYVDHSGQPRSPESLVRRLRNLNMKGLAIGGVLGAKHHYPELNIVGAPRLDVCVHAPGKTARIDFMKEIDPGLRRSDDPYGPTRVALHFLRRDDAMFSLSDDGAWADPIECLADLSEARLEGVAAEFQEFIAQQGEKLSGRA